VACDFKRGRQKNCIRRPQKLGFFKIQASNAVFKDGMMTCWFLFAT